MKLKKIASLALAGIMAVSMLAGCNGSNGGNGGASSSEPTNPSTGLSAAILEETDLAKKYAVAEDYAKLNNAVNAVVKNAAPSYVTGVKNLNTLDNETALVNLSKSIMTGATYCDTSNTIVDALNNAATKKEDIVAYRLFYTSRTSSDDVIANMIANQLDTIATQLSLPQTADGDSYEYTVSVAKSDWLAGNEADVTKDGVVVGIAIHFDYTKAEF